MQYMVPANKISSVRDGKTPHFDYITFVFDEYYEYLTNNLINKRTEQEQNLEMSYTRTGTMSIINAFLQHLFFAQQPILHSGWLLTSGGSKI